MNLQSHLATFKKGITMFWLLTGLIPCLAQESKIGQLIGDLAARITEVETGGTMHQQSLRSEKDRPWRLVFYTASTDKKGKATEMEYHLNLADIDENTVHYTTKKEVMFLTMRTERQQSFIQTWKNGEIQNYENSLSIKASDGDNAKELQKLFKEAIPLAQESVEEIIPSGNFDGQMEWTEANLGGVDKGDGVFSQRWEPDPTMQSRVKLMIEKSGKKGSLLEERTFNLADFGEHTVKLVVKGKEVFVEAKVRRNKKFIEVWKDGKKTNFENTMKLFVNDIDQARVLLMVLQAMIKEAEIMVKGIVPESSTKEDLLRMLSEQVQDIEIGENAYKQSWKPLCQSKFNLKKIDSKGETAEQLSFHLGDMRPSSFSTEVSKNEIFLSFKTNGQKLVQRSKNGEPENYTDAVRFRAAGIENMRVLREVLPKTIKACQEFLELETKSLDNIETSPIEFLSGQTHSIRREGSEIGQRLEQMEGDCKWRFTKIDAGEKKSTEEIWEFNNEDLDPVSVQFNVSKKQLFVEVNTLHKEKIVKYYKNSEPDDYANSMKIMVENVEQGRAFIAVWKNAIEKCQE